MKDIGRPAWQLTARSITVSFLASGKQHLILTGGRKSGKTTLFGEVLALLSDEPVNGITSFAVPGKAVFLRANDTGEEAVAGVFDPSLPGTENRMRPVIEGFLTLGVDALRRAAEAPGEWAAIDDLESGCAPYCEAVGRLMERKRTILVLRRQPLPFIDALLARGDVFTVDLDDPFGNVGCVVMASGMGRRFGGNKLMADFLGIPLIGHILRTTEQLFTDRVVVTRHLDAAEYCREMGVKTILHDLPHRSDTVRLGIGQMGESERCLFTPGDQPLLEKDTVMALLLAAKNDPRSIWRTAYAGTPGAPILFPSDLYPELAALPEGKGGGYLAKKYPERVRLIPVREAYELKDIDEQADLSALLSIRR